MELKIKYLEGATELVNNEKGDLIDVYAYEDMFIPFMGYGMINLGFALELPEGYMAKLVPRSSTFKTWGIIQTNHIGIIDESFRGDNDLWHLPVQCTMPKTTEKVNVEGHKVTLSGVWIRKGDKIAQFEICEKPKRYTFKAVESLNNEDRGSSSVYGEYDKAKESTPTHKPKYKIGDKVRIKPLEELKLLFETDDYDITKDMLSYAGMNAVVTNTFGESRLFNGVALQEYALDLDDGFWIWRDNMIDKAE